MLPLLLPKTIGKFTIASLNPSGYWRADTGVKSNAAAHFTSANSEYLSRTSNSGLQTGDIGFWVSAWVYLDNNSDNQVFVSKWSVTDKEYALNYNLTANRFRFTVDKGGTATFVDADVLGSPAIATWYHLLGWHNATSDTLNISVNNGTPNSLSYSNGLTANNGLFQIGSVVNGTTQFTNGRIDSVAFGKSPPGGIAGIISAINTSLYNSETAKKYGELTAAEKTAWGLVSFWGLNVVSGQRDDSHGTNHLTDNNTVETILGKATEADPLDRWSATKQNDQSVNARNFTAPAKAAIPSYKTAEINGLPVIRYDGVNDISTTPDFADVGNGNTEISVFMVVKGTAVTNRHILAHWDTNSQRSWVIGKGNANNAKMRVQLSGDGAAVGKDYESSTTVFGDSNPHIIGFTYDGTTLSTYVDSKTAEASPTKTVDAATPTLHNSTAAITEGASLATGVGQLYASFDVAERVIKNAKMSASQISNLINLWSAKYNIALS